jgi:hypothetical protein
MAAMARDISSGSKFAFDSAELDSAELDAAEFPSWIVSRCSQPTKRSKLMAKINRRLVK